MHLSKDFSFYLKQIELTLLMIDQQTSFFPEFWLDTLSVFKHFVFSGRFGTSRI